MATGVMATASRPAEPGAGPEEPRVRAALRILQVGLIACVLAAAPFPAFDLERHLVPKELVLHAAGFGAACLLLGRARRLALSAADLLLAVFLLLSVVSALAAGNHWLALRGFGVSLSGALVFWSARALAQRDLGRPLVVALALATALAAGTALLQAYGVESRFWAERRAPGGAFGNRNFMAHFVALGIPGLVLVGLGARRRGALVLTAAGTALVAAALALSRSRAAWLGAAVWVVLFSVEGLWAGELWYSRAARRRLAALGAAAAAGVALALALPNTLSWRSDSPYLDTLVGIADYREGSGRGRLIQYRNTLRMARDHPLLGVGPGNWPVAYPRYTTPGDPAFDPNDFIPTNPWPSSDWVALAAERGVPALASIVLAGAALGFGAWRRWRRAGPAGEGLEGLAAVLTLAVLAVVSSFDAVLLLPTPTFFVGAALGVLTRPPKRLALTFPLKDRRRRRLLAAAAAVGGLLVLRSAGQIAAMAAYGDGTRLAAVERAARIDPGSYRLQMLAAYGWRDRNRCAAARGYAAAAQRLFPNHPAPRALLAACRRAR